MSTTSDSVVQALARLHSYADRKTSEPRRNELQITVAISRQAGSRGAEIARAVGAQLRWPVYDHEILDRIAQEKGLHRRLLEQLDERHLSWLEEVMRSFGSNSTYSESGYIRHLLEQFASLGEVGHCLIVGRGAAQVLPAENTLRVRVIASRPFRVAAIAKEKSLSQEEAERWVDRTDQERTRFVQQVFHKDPTDPTGYDLILNSERLGKEVCMRLIIEAALGLEAALRQKQPAASV